MSLALHYWMGDVWAYITAQGPRLRNNLYCVEWDVKLHTIRTHYQFTELPNRQYLYTEALYTVPACCTIFRPHIGLSMRVSSSSSSSLNIYMAPITSRTEARPTMNSYFYTHYRKLKALQKRLNLRSFLMSVPQLYTQDVGRKWVPRGLAGAAEGTFAELRA